MVSRLVAFYFIHTTVSYNCITINLARFLFVNPILNTEGDFQTKINGFRLKINTFLDLLNTVLSLNFALA